MNIFRQEIKTYLRSTIIWTSAYCLAVFGFLSIFQSFSGDVAASKHLLAGYPPQVLAALNIQLDSFFTIYGFFGYLLTYLALMGAMQAMNLGLAVLSKEISGKTADFLLSKPVTRVRMLTEKLAAVFVLLVGTSVFFISAAFISAQIFSTSALNTQLFLLLTMTLFLIQMFFLALGFFLAAVVPKIKSVLAYSLPIVFGLFILSLFGSVIGKKEIDYLTPFKYFDSSYIVKNVAYDPKFLWVLGGFVLFCVVGSYIVFITKDIEAAS